MAFGTLQQEIYDLTTDCHICKKEIMQDRIAVRDYDHRSGIFRGKAHQSCNLNFKNRFDVLLFAHNNNRYDSHFLI